MSKSEPRERIEYYDLEIEVELDPYKSRNKCHN